MSVVIPISNFIIDVELSYNLPVNQDIHLPINNIKGLLCTGFHFLQIP